MLLHLSTWPEVETYLESSRGIIIPIGSTEQHGPTGLIGTDAIAAEAISRAVGEAANALVAPTINVGMAGISSEDVARIKSNRILFPSLIRGAT
jgi:Uncharacterized protein, putative amidase